MLSFNLIFAHACGFVSALVVNIALAWLDLSYLYREVRAKQIKWYDYGKRPPILFAIAYLIQFGSICIGLSMAQLLLRPVESLEKSTLGLVQALQAASESQIQSRVLLDLHNHMAIFGEAYGNGRWVIWLFRTVLGLGIAGSAISTVFLNNHLRSIWLFGTLLMLAILLIYPAWLSYKFVRNISRSRNTALQRGWATSMTVLSAFSLLVCLLCSFLVLDYLVQLKDESKVNNSALLSSNLVHLVLSARWGWLRFRRHDNWDKSLRGLEEQRNAKIPGDVANEDPHPSTTGSECRMGPLHTIAAVI